MTDVHEPKFQRLSLLELLPIELLYEIQLFALSPSLPHTSHHLYQIFKSASPYFQAEYIFLRVQTTPGNFYAKVLRYPLCSSEVIRFINRYAIKHGITSKAFELPRRLFRDLTPTKDHPLSFIQELYSMGFSPDVNSNSGYALTKAVQSGSIVLAQYLLDKGASPALKKNLPIRVAIRQKNLQMVKLLIERHGTSMGIGSKKRKLADRVEVTKEMLKFAVKCNAQDIVDYFTQEKGCVPDMQTLYLMR
ncbi:hypothetical protein BDP27DRAFT_1331202 [Rhodocollybia butyracea]|uniref:Ankyrin repeat protein n=1 Tax=Rhodocollybia butyracea TaxID=206335 RepID=A0A9P5PLK4_9AGAR|nr:hypothetical protein BDP27DRAFT_1331202 [Rhodocollybia butyracea]